METNKDEKYFNVPMKIEEMQMIADCVGSYFKMLARKKVQINVKTATLTMQFMQRMKAISQHADQEPTIITGI